MTQAEVGKLLAFITAVYPNIDIRDGTVEAWHELLKDLEFKITLAAVKKVIAESQIPALPALGKIRSAALDLQHGYSITAPEAWGLLLRAVKRHGFYGELEAMQELPPDVAQVVRWMGWREICHSTTPDVIRAQFMRMFETQTKRTKELAGLPADVKELLQGLGSALSMKSGGQRPEVGEPDKHEPKKDALLHEQKIPERSEDRSTNDKPAKSKPASAWEKKTASFASSIKVAATKNLPAASGAK